LKAERAIGAWKRRRANVGWGSWKSRASTASDSCMPASMGESRALARFCAPETLLERLAGKREMVTDDFVSERGKE